MSGLLLWLILASIFLAYATWELVMRLKKREPAWKSVRRWLLQVFDTLSGG
jgi:uncharacterized membrane protein